MWTNFFSPIFNWLSRVSGLPVELVIGISIILVIIVVIAPKRFLKLSQHVAERQKQRQIPYKVIIGICRKCEFRGKGFGNQNDTVFYNLGDTVWAGQAGNGMLQTVYKYGEIQDDGSLKRTYNTTSEDY